MPARRKMRLEDRGNACRPGVAARPHLLSQHVLVVVSLLCCACSPAPAPPPEPQSLELGLGQTGRVMQGRASIWFAQPDEEWRDDLNQIVPVARVEVACKGEAFGRVVFKDKPTDPVCGIRLQLLRIEEPDMGATPPRTFRAYFRVSPE